MNTIMHDICDRNDDSDEAISLQYGALPWRKDKRGDIELMLVTTRRRGRWIVPKGWGSPDRAPYLSAAMEAFEEAGVIGEIVPTAVGTYDYTKEGKDGALTPCRVTLFPLRVRGTLTHWPERGERQRRWLPISDAADLVDNPELADIVDRIDAQPQLLTAPMQILERNDG